MNHFHALTVRWQRLAELELDWCRRFNRATDKQGLERLFAWVSRLGDGVFWYALMLALLLAQGYSALPTVGRMAVVGFLGLAAYKWLKAKIGRPRPCTRHALIRATVPPWISTAFPPATRCMPWLSAPSLYFTIHGWAGCYCRSPS